MQNAAARLIAGTRKFEHIRLILACLHWLPIRFQAQFKVLVLTSKALHGLGPQYLTERLSRHEPTRTLRSTSKALFWLPTLLQGKLGGRQQGRGPFQWWPPNYGMISPMRLAWCQHCYLSVPGQDLSLLPGSKQHVLSLFVLMESRIVVLKKDIAGFTILLFLCFSWF